VKNWPAPNRPAPKTLARLARSTPVFSLASRNCTYAVAIRPNSALSVAEARAPIEARSAAWVSLK